MPKAYFNGRKTTKTIESYIYNPTRASTIMTDGALQAPFLIISRFIRHHHRSSLRHGLSFSINAPWPPFRPSSSEIVLAAHTDLVLQTWQYAFIDLCCSGSIYPPLHLQTHSPMPRSRSLHPCPALQVCCLGECCRRFGYCSVDKSVLVHGNVSTRDEIPQRRWKSG